LSRTPVKAEDITVQQESLYLESNNPVKKNYENFKWM